MDETPDDDDDCGDGLAALDEEVTVNLSSATPILLLEVSPEGQRRILGARVWAN